jgi:hypothetical protein
MSYREARSSTGTASSPLGQQVAAAWNQFWFAPQATSTLALLRIGFGLVTLAWSLSLAPDLGAFFSTTGVLPKQPGAGGVWGVLGVFHSDTALGILFVALLLACVALIAGYHTRLASVVVFVGILSFERRNPYVFNSGDGLLRLMAFYLMLAPAGAALSVDRWRRARDRFWEFPARAPWGLRLMQIQLSVVYLSTLWLKLQGTYWNHGTAVSYAQRLTDLARFPLPPFVFHSATISNLLTYGTLLIEASVPVLIWNRRLRPYVAAIGISLHIAIGYSIRVGFFSIAMITLYLSFVDPEWATQRLLAGKEAMERYRVRRRRTQAAVV